MTSSLHALAAAAAPAERRLQAQKVCFIGMWGPRKGSREWPQNHAAIWARHPATEFVFLGTMFDEAVVRADLGFAQTTEDFVPAHFRRARPAITSGRLHDWDLSQSYRRLRPRRHRATGRRCSHHRLRRAGTAPDPGGTKGAPPHPGGRYSRDLRPGRSNCFPYRRDDIESLSASCIEIARRYRWQEIAESTIKHYRAALFSLGPAIARRRES